MIRQEYELNLIPYVSPLVKVNVSQYDRGSRELAFKFVKGDKPFSIPSDASVKIQGLKSDDNAFEYAMTVSGNEAVIALQEQMTAVAGQVVCQIVFTKEDGSLLGTANFMLSVEPSPMDEDAITSETDIPALNVLINGGNKPGQIIEWDGEKVGWSDPIPTKWGELEGNIGDQKDLKDALDAKVNTEAGKGLSSNDYTTEEKNKLSSLPTSEEIATALGNKVDKVTGMGLSENSYTTAEKAKLADLPTDVELEQELAAKVDKETGKGLSTNDYSNADKDKLDALPTNAELIDTLANKADLGSDGKVPATQLPSYVDDVLEYASISEFPVTGETGKIYIALDTNKTYRWGGSLYVEISESLALGETSSTAYRGDHGKIAYNHSQVKSGNPHNVSKSDVGLGNVDNTSDMDKPISTAVQGALDLKQDTLTFDSTPTAGSTNPVTSAGIAAEFSDLNDALSTKANTDDVNDALALKQDALTFDATPTANSNNPVYSKGIKSALDAQKYFYIDSEGYGCINYDLFQTA